MEWNELELFAANDDVTAGRVKAIISLLPHVKYKYRPHEKEWKIAHKDAKWGNGYFTNDHQDAINTAKSINRHYENGVK
jgi:hypothetical protein